MTGENTIKVLVLTQNYPNNSGGVSLMYIHTRNKRYIENGIDVTVLNFSSDKQYYIDNIKVITLKDYSEENEKYDVLILHAANIRNHYRFLKKYGDRFERFIFFYHGHEVMRINSDYAPPYDYMRKNVFKRKLQDIYDEYKLHKWRKYLLTVLNKSHFVFVSKWMKTMFDKNIGINESLIRNRYSITYNSVGSVFEEQQYDEDSEKTYDFITIRSSLDGSKYAVDIVNELSRNTPEGKFLVIGKGKLFDHIKKADNLEWINRSLNHEEIISFLNKSRYGLMPTRTDAQGLMMCEMAAFGIPVITSDIDVCHEVFDGFENAFYINNNNINYSLSEYLRKKIKAKKDTRYFMSNTASKEIELIKKVALNSGE